MRHAVTFADSFNGEGNSPFRTFRQSVEVLNGIIVDVKNLNLMNPLSGRSSIVWFCFILTTHETS